MVDDDTRTTFSATEVTEIRSLLSDLLDARRSVQRMSLARLRRMGLSLEPPTQARFDELVSSGTMRVTVGGDAAKAVIRRRSGNVFRVAVGVTGHPVPATWSAFDQRYQWFGTRPKSVTSGAHLFVLAVDRWKSAVVGLYETVTAGADKLPDSPDQTRWPWALGVRPLAAVSPPDAERVDGQIGPQNGLPASIKDAAIIQRLYEAVADSPPPPGPETLEQRVQELEWQDVLPDVLEAVQSLGNQAREPIILPRAIELGGWSEEELRARAWYTGSGVDSHIGHIVRQALQVETGALGKLRRTHGVYSLTAPASGVGFGVPYRQQDRNGAQTEMPSHISDLAELDRATKRHMDLQDVLADALRVHGLEPLSPASWEPQFDLGFKNANARYVIEVKSGSPVTTQQTRLGAGQVLEYRHLLSVAGPDPVQAVLFVEADPPPPWDTLIGVLGIQLLRADKLETSLSALLLGVE